MRIVKVIEKNGKKASFDGFHKLPIETRNALKVINTYAIGISQLIRTNPKEALRKLLTDSNIHMSETLYKNFLKKNADFQKKFINDLIDYQKLCLHMMFKDRLLYRTCKNITEEKCLNRLSIVYNSMKQIEERDLFSDYVATINKTVFYKNSKSIANPLSAWIS